MLIAIGGGNVYSFYKGRGEPEKANNVFCQCLALAAVVGFVLTAAGFIFREKLALILGANAELLPSAIAYLKWLTLFSILQMVVFCFSIFVRNDDAPKLVMLATVAGAVINMILDIIFILFLGYGIEVAAITNGIGVLIELAFYAVYFMRKKGLLRIRKPKIDFSDIKRVIRNGISASLMEFWQSAIALSFNLALVYTVGTLGVSAYSIVNYVTSVINMILIGVTQGAQPIMSFYHGKGDEKVVSYVYRLGVRTNFIVPLVFTGLCAAFGHGIASLFHSGNPELTALTAHMLRLYPLAFVVAGVTLMNILYFQTTERNTYSNLTSGIAPVRRMLNEGLHVALGSDIAGGALLSMLDVAAQAVRVSKINWLNTQGQEPFLTVAEAFYLITSAGQEYFGAGPGLQKGDMLHALVIDDRALLQIKNITPEQRLERLMYLPEGRRITACFSEGKRML